MDEVKFSIPQVVAILKGELLQSSRKEEAISDILIDSRRLIAPEQCLFFALVTRRNDGHRYIGELYDRGVRHFVISNPQESPEKYPEASFIRVPDTLAALQDLCAAHRKKFRIPVIGITGSNGKTVIKEWLFQLLSPDHRVIRSPKSYNSQIGVPLSVWQIQPDHDLGIFEAGISEPDEMQKLQAIIQPTLGIFTNIGAAHNENFIHTRHKAGEKLKLFTRVDTLIYCLDYTEIRETVIRSGLLESIRVFTWSRKQEADMRIVKTLRQSGKSLIRASFSGKEFDIRIPFTDHASIENAIHCWAALRMMGYDHDVIASRMMHLQPVAMRLEMKEGINHCSVINDSYNSDINSLAIALDFLNQQNQHRSRTVILSDILQSGRNDDELYGEIADLMEKKGIRRLIGIGPAISRQADKFPMEKVFFPDTQEFLRKFSFSSFQNESILLKGARMFEFEQISQALQQKAHETILEINMNALIHNLNYFRTRLKPTTRIMAMVKAFSYGTGSFEIANVLQFHRVDYLAVAYADEAVELRKAGIIIPIMVVNPDEQSMDAIIKHNLEPEIYSFRVLDLLEDAIRKNILPDNKPVKVHIKLDTGMHRLGFDPEEADGLIARLEQNRHLLVQSVFSHLAAAEDPDEDHFTRRQLEQFGRLAARFREAFGNQFLLHILNSAGISRFPEAQHDMVRLGISLYGVASWAPDHGHLENVVTLRTVISQIRNIPAGETVGYNRSWTAERDTMVAVIPIGYADGLSRRLSNGNGKVVIRGQEAPLVGYVSMDMAMVDVTGISAREGDDVIIFGREYP
ncbi:MAG: bifunctional UDP-N-acetylmuramoyl-tripeptide:D-alanyl-D-alanine ligase/alanine racemase, partial [Bacteroidales bacterium]|nr:bifunctional UDP-N-acetylmuramoyl-tripeptide:D-alanyl-D-alanine ligase/alanine racemase [Bacteroidales bacterium]